MTRHVDLLVAEVQYENSLRLLEPDSIPKLRKPFRRRVPNTALIAQVCAAKAAARGVAAPAAVPAKAEPKPDRKRKRSRYTYGKGGKRQLTIAEVSELQDCVSAARKTRCRPTNQCWEVGCVRCSPP